MIIVLVLFTVTCMFKGACHVNSIIKTQVPIFHHQTYLIETVRRRFICDTLSHRRMLPAVKLWSLLLFLLKTKHVARSLTPHPSGLCLIFHFIIITTLYSWPCTFYLQGAKITYEREANLVIDYSSLSRGLKQVRTYLQNPLE